MNETVAMKTATIGQEKSKKALSPIFIIGALFFIFGFITWLNSVLIPYLRIACELTNVESYLVAFCFYIAYFVMAIPSATVLKYTGFKKGMSAGLVTMAVGALLFIPAAMSRTYGLFLLGLFIQGTGLAVLQTASNPYITLLGPPESAARRISIMGICNKIAGGIAPIVLGAITLSNVDELVSRLATMDAATKALELDLLAQKVIFPYVIIIGVLLFMAIVIYFSSLPEVHEQESDLKVDSQHQRQKPLTGFPNLWFGILALFLYVGAEVIAGDTIINYAASTGIEFSNAKFFATLTLGAMIVGYLAGIITIPRYISQAMALKISAILGALLSLTIITTEGTTSVWCVALLGLANALVWPAIWPLALAGLGKFTRIGSSLLIMAIAGGAVLPLVYGKIADSSNLQNAYWILIPCYLFIWFYAAFGHRIGKSSSHPVKEV